MNSVPPQRGLLDTQVLLEIRAGFAAPFDFAMSMLQFAKIEVSELSAMELLAGCQTPDDLQRELTFLSNGSVYRITAKISQRAFRIIGGLPPPCGLTADDAIIAATAVEHKLPLYTLDPARFAPVSGLNALRPY